MGFDASRVEIDGLTDHHIASAGWDTAEHWVLDHWTIGVMFRLPSLWTGRHYPG